MINNLLLIALILALPSCGWGKKEKKDEHMETQSLFHDRYYDDEERTRITGRRKHPLTGRYREEHYREEEERPARGTKRYREEETRTREERRRDENRTRLTHRKKLRARDNDDDIRRGSITGRPKLIQ